jgi:hypothetical protein
MINYKPYFKINYSYNVQKCQETFQNICNKRDLNYNAFYEIIMKGY